jgi:rare lipoprotein A
MKRRLTFVLAIVLLSAGCAKKKHAAAPPAPPPAAMPHVGDEEVGIASWYGHPYHGRPSSSGEIYDMEKLTAAHRTLPFGTMVEVLNLANDRTVEVRINDRGPFVESRIIDLSHAAARKINMIGPGTAKVRLRIVSLPDTAAPGYYAVQVGAFRDKANAERERKRMQALYGTARTIRRDGNPATWRVIVGHAGTLDAATALARQIRAASGAAFVVRVDGPQTDI